jgi:hypothetical protein
LKGELEEGSRGKGRRIEKDRERKGKNVKDGWKYKVGTKQDDRFYQSELITRNFSPKETTTRGFFSEFLVQAGCVYWP